MMSSLINHYIISYPEDMIQEPEPTEDDPDERIPRKIINSDVMVMS